MIHVYVYCAEFGLSEKNYLYPLCLSSRVPCSLHLFLSFLLDLSSFCLLRFLAFLFGAFFWIG